MGRTTVILNYVIDRPMASLPALHDEIEVVIIIVMYPIKFLKI